MSLQNWTAYFEELNSLLLNSERHYGTADLSQADYLIERFELAVQTCSSIIDGLVNPSIPIEAEEQIVLADCIASIRELVTVIRSLSAKWHEYRQIHSDIRTLGYATPVPHTGQRGRPKFDVDKEQIEYLLSLSFNWMEIAALLGISRMTLYRLGGLCDVFRELESVQKI